MQQLEKSVTAAEKSPEGFKLDSQQGTQKRRTVWQVISSFFKGIGNFFKNIFSPKAKAPSVPFQGSNESPASNPDVNKNAETEQHVDGDPSLKIVEQPKSETKEEIPNNTGEKEPPNPEIQPENPKISTNTDDPEKAEGNSSSPTLTSEAPANQTIEDFVNQTPQQVLQGQGTTPEGAEAGKGNAPIGDVPPPPPAPPPPPPPPAPKSANLPPTKGAQNINDVKLRKVDTESRGAVSFPDARGMTSEALQVVRGKLKKIDDTAKPSPKVETPSTDPDSLSMDELLGKIQAIRAVTEIREDTIHMDPVTDPEDLKQPLGGEASFHEVIEGKRFLTKKDMENIYKTFLHIPEDDDDVHIEYGAFDVETQEEEKWLDYSAARNREWGNFSEGKTDKQLFDDLKAAIPGLAENLGDKVKIHEESSVTSTTLGDVPPPPPPPPPPTSAPAPKGPVSIVTADDLKNVSLRKVVSNPKPAPKAESNDILVGLREVAAQREKEDLEDENADVSDDEDW